MNLIANRRTIGKAIRRIGWRKVTTQYCQIAEPRNRVKRFIYCCFCKIFNETFQDSIDADETSIEVRLCSNTNWKKPGISLLRPAGGELGQPKHNYKIHLFGSISRHGLTPLIMLTGTMYSKDYQNCLSAGILPFIRERMPYYHRFYMDNDPKHTRYSTKRFIVRNNINHFETPPQSPDLMPIEMVRSLNVYLADSTFK